MAFSPETLSVPYCLDSADAGTHAEAFDSLVMAVDIVCLDVHNKDLALAVQRFVSAGYYLHILDLYDHYVLQYHQNRRRLSLKMGSRSCTVVTESGRHCCS